MTVLSVLIPSEQEKKEIEKTIYSVKRNLRRVLFREGISCKIESAGSTAKDTYLPGDTDIDIFVVCNNPQKAYDVIKHEYPHGHRKPGELLIWNVNQNGYDIDFVFIHPESKQTATLRHTEFFRKHLSLQQRNEVRKAKALFKSKGVYGAEIGGITGVAIEELVRRHKTLDGVCKFIINQKEKPWVQDPVLDRPRNLLASVVPERWKQIQKVCKDYLATRKVEYKRYTQNSFVNERVREGFHVVVLPRKKERPQDYYRARKICVRSCNQLINLEKPDINTCMCDVYVGAENVVVAFKVEPQTLPPAKEVCIPKALPSHAIQAFKQAHPNYYEKNNKICAVVKRKITNPQRWLRAQIKTKW